MDTKQPVNIIRKYWDIVQETVNLVYGRIDPRCLFRRDAQGARYRRFYVNSNPPSVPNPVAPYTRGEIVNLTQVWKEQITSQAVQLDDVIATCYLSILELVQSYNTKPVISHKTNQVVGGKLHTYIRSHLPLHVKRKLISSFGNQDKFWYKPSDLLVTEIPEVSELSEAKQITMYIKASV